MSRHMQPPAPPPAQQQQQRQNQAATHERTSGAPGSSAAPAASIAPAEVLHSAPSTPPENVAIDPVPDASNDPSLVFEWKQVKLGSNQSWGFTVTSSDGGSLSGTLEQGIYRKALQGTGSLNVPIIPAAANGTSGSLSVTNDATGASARYTWQWQPIAAIARVTGGVSKVLQGRTKTATGTKSATAAATEARQQQARQRRGGCQTQFFGQVAMGRRFAFILDRSGSMAGQRWQTCTQELTSALNALSADAEFFVILFSSGTLEPPGQRDWMEASAQNVAAVLQWLSNIHPDGTTEPAPAFKRVFSLSKKADATYFLTDGELFGFNANACRRLRESGGGFFKSLGKMFSPRSDEDDWDPVINTISLDDNSSAKELKKMAEESGGTYVHMTSAPAG
jgi:hypothetical protein